MNAAEADCGSSACDACFAIEIDAEGAMANIVDVIVEFALGAANVDVVEAGVCVGVVVVDIADVADVAVAVVDVDAVDLSDLSEETLDFVADLVVVAVVAVSVVSVDWYPLQ